MVRLPFFLLCFFFLTSINNWSLAQEAARYNVLFIASDDLNTDLGCYGNTYVKTPNLDGLAARGMLFKTAYTQYPLCSPSRSSLLTGMRPDRLGIYDLETHFRTQFPTITTLPQLFKQSGYFSARIGKIFHYGVPGQIGTSGLDDTPSWNLVINPSGRDRLEEHLVKNLTPHRYMGAGLAWHMAGGTDVEQTDGLVTTGAIELLKAYRDTSFFISVGYFRPHSPYIATEKYFSLYPKESIPLAQEATADEVDIPDAALFTKPAHWGLDKEAQQEVKRAYYASVSFLDAQVGRLLVALDSLGLSENTIIVFWSDHGYNLGQHGQWKKQSLFEQATKVPLIVVAPGFRKNQQSERTVELLDIYPTLAGLAGLPVPDHVEGNSLVPLLKDPMAPWDMPAYSQVMRGNVAGRSVRTERWRYTEWDEGRAGAELYDHDNDPHELRNLYSNKNYSKTVSELRSLLRVAGIFNY